MQDTRVVEVVSIVKPPPPAPVKRRTFTTKDLLVLGGSAASSLALTWLLYSQMLPFSGLQGFLLFWAGTFLGMYYTSVRELDNAVVAKDRAMAALIAIVAVALMIPLALIVIYVTVKGAQYVRLAFFTTDMETVSPTAPPQETGGLASLVGTFEQVGIAMLVSVPLGVLTAVYLNEVGGRLRRPVRIFVDAMSGVPSIVAGLFIYSVLVVNTTFSGFAAALALSILMLPTVTRTCEVVLRLVPDGLREASLAMGSPEWRTVSRVVLPTARSGVITAIILGVARVVGETAPLIMTAFGNPVTNLNPFNGAQAALPLSAFRAFGGTPQDVERAWVFAFVLLAIVLILFVSARWMARRSVLNR